MFFLFLSVPKLRKKSCCVIQISVSLSSEWAGFGKNLNDDVFSATINGTALTLGFVVRAIGITYFYQWN